MRDTINRSVYTDTNQCLLFGQHFLRFHVTVSLTVFAYSQMLTVFSEISRTVHLLLFSRHEPKSQFKVFFSLRTFYSALSSKYFSHEEKLECSNKLSERHSVIPTHVLYRARTRLGKGRFMKISQIFCFFVRFHIKFRISEHSLVFMCSANIVEPLLSFSIHRKFVT